jgi:acyl-CoA thioester hydrolase
VTVFDEKFLPAEATVWHETRVRVRYAETDKMGVVYHANYLIWFEIGRTEFCRAHGFSYREMEREEGVFLAVAESYCRYKQPAVYDDEIVIRTHIAECRRRSLRFGYEILRAADKEILAEGETTLVAIDSENRVRSIPEKYRQMLLLAPEPQESINKSTKIPEKAPS